MASPESSFSHLSVFSCLGVELELAFLPHFLDHYIGVGVEPRRIHIILNASRPDAPAVAEARTIIAARGAAEPHLWIAPYTSDAMWAERRALQARVAGPRDWILNADADEHHAYLAPPAEIAAYCDRKSYRG